MDANWWNNALQSYDVGREHRADRENAQAFQEGGYDAVEQAAGNRGDLRTAMTTRRFQDERQNQAYQWFEQNAPRARNVLRRARAIQDPQQRGAFLNSQRQWFEGVGFEAPKIDAAIAGLVGPESEQWFDNLDAGFAQYEDPNWQLVQTPEGQRAVSIDRQGGKVQLGGLVPGGGAGRYATDDEVAAAGYRPGSVVWIEPGQPPRVIQAPSAARSTGAQYYPDDGYDYVEE